MYTSIVCTLSIPRLPWPSPCLFISQSPLQRQKTVGFDAVFLGSYELVYPFLQHLTKICLWPCDATAVSNLSDCSSFQAQQRYIKGLLGSPSQHLKGNVIFLSLNRA